MRFLDLEVEWGHLRITWKMLGVHGLERLRTTGLMNSLERFVVDALPEVGAEEIQNGYTTVSVPTQSYATGYAATREA